MFLQTGPAAVAQRRRGYMTPATTSHQDEATVQHQQHQPGHCYLSLSDCPDSDDSHPSPTTTLTMQDNNSIKYNAIHN